MISQNPAKVLKMFIYIYSKIGSHEIDQFEKIDLWWISHANRNINISYVETSIAK